MTDQYYKREDEVETPETQLANLQAHTSAVEAVKIWAQETLVQAYDRTLALWNEAAALREAAEQRGDQKAVEKLVVQQNGLSEIYKMMENMQRNLLHTNTAISSVLETAHALNKQKGEIEKDLSSLLKAIDDGDYDEPRLRDLIEQIEQDAYEMASESSFDDAYEAAVDNIYDDLYAGIKRQFPNVSHMTIASFINTLDGNAAMNDIQRGLLLSLLHTFEVEAQAS